MDETALKRRLPTFVGFWERRKKAAKNKLPKHLRPPTRWPIAVQIALNLTIFFAFVYLMTNVDDFGTEAVPAIGLVVCTFLLLYTLDAAIRLKRRYKNLKGSRWAAFNLGLMILAFFMLPLAILTFLR